MSISHTLGNFSVRVDTLCADDEFNSLNISCSRECLNKT